MTATLNTKRYYNGIVGKWDLGPSPVLAPTQRGFDGYLPNSSGDGDYIYRTN